MLIDSWFALFGLERGPPSVWLCCTLFSHIFHDCVGYRAANHMCYPLSGAVAMASFLPSLSYYRPLFVTLGFAFDLIVILCFCFVLDNTACNFVIWWLCDDQADDQSTFEWLQILCYRSVMWSSGIYSHSPAGQTF